MNQTTAAPDTLLLAEEAVPLDAAQGQLDAALAAQLEVPAFVPPAPTPVADPGVSLVVPLMLAVVLVLLFGLRALALGGRGWIARFVRPAAPGSAPERAAPLSSRPARRVEKRPAASPPKPPPPPPPRKTVELPPHVAAMLARSHERRSAEAPPRVAVPPEPEAPTPTSGDRGLDVVIGS